MPTLKKRMCLARFMVDVEIPSELMLDEDMNMLHAQFSCLREQFKAAHHHLDVLRKSERDPSQIRQRVQELEVERDHLQSKILKVKSKLQDVDRAEKIYEVVDQLKFEKVEEENYLQALKDQTQLLHQVQDGRNRATSKLHQLDIQIAEARCNPNYVEKILQDNEALRDHVKEKIPKEVRAKQKRLCAIQKVLSVSDTPDGLTGIQARLLAVNAEIRLLTTKLAQASNGEGSEWQQEKMAIITANKARAAFERLANLTASKEQLVKKIDQKHGAIDEVEVTVKHGEDLKEYVDRLRNKSITYRKMKKEMDELTAQYEGLLQRQQYLEQEQLSGQNVKGIDMHEEENTRSDKLYIAGQLASADVLKISVFEVRALVEEMRSKVDLQVKSLSDVRAALEDMQVEREAGKQQCNGVRLLFEKKIAKLKADICAIAKECETDSIAVQNRVAAIEDLQAAALQVTTERKDGAVSRKLNAEVEQQQVLMNRLQQQEQKLKEMEHASAAQKTMMKDLLTLLMSKLSPYSSVLKPTIFSTAASLETAEK